MKTEFRESETLELKRSTSELKPAVVSIAAILNKHGFGELYFGIKDDGTVVGQGVSGKTLRDISQAIAENIEPKIYPEIKAVIIEGKHCIYLKFEGEDGPYYAFGRVYKRVGDEDRKLSAKEIENSILKKYAGKIAWESQPSKIGITGLNEAVVKKFIEKANAVGRLEFKYENMANTLHKLNLVENGRLLNAAGVLFSDENSLEVQVAIFAGKDKLTFLDIGMLRGSLFDLLDEMELYITKHIKWRVKFGKLEREEIPEIPLRAVREALVNSLCHRDYKVPKGNEIAIFKDRVEIYNPGHFPEGLTPADFIEGRERSVLRNPLIARTMFLSKDVEKWGSGIKRIYEECLESRVSVEFLMLKTGFTVIFSRPQTDDSVSPEDIDESIVENEDEYKDGHENGDFIERIEKLYDYINANPGHRISSISEALDIPLRTAERLLKKLRSEDRIEFIGSRKAGGYFPKREVTAIESEDEEKLYDYIKANPGQKAAFISEVLDIPLRTVERRIKKMKKMDVIEFIGDRKSGGYYLKERPGSDGCIVGGINGGINMAD